ncbi:CDP-glycerol glycerophosphotransferase family protein, partial [Peribacillus frigoritolerans]|uniref:CDP-glycerol glycerophosphotransferase family protein n=1 Tax=Peribacillus frigoritolerans TaxID=450367 RepID=UPI00300927C7
ILETHKNYELIWVGKKNVLNQVSNNKNVKKLKLNSWLSYYYSVTASCAFVTQDHRDITKYNIFRGTKLVQLWHGIPLKKIGSDIINVRKKGLMLLLEKTKVKTTNNFDFFIASSMENKNKLLTAFKHNNINETKILLTGQPRNDYLINNRNNSLELIRIRNKLKLVLGIPNDKKIIIYLPTFRDNRNNYFSFQNVSIRSKLMDILQENNAVIIEKMHFVTNKNLFKQEDKVEKSSLVFQFENEESLDTQQLLLVADILITDYSSCYFDYTLMDKPIIHYLYDHDEYISLDRPLYYDIRKVVGGEIVTDFENLIRVIERSLSNPAIDEEKRENVKNFFLENEAGNSSERILKTIL